MSERELWTEHLFEKHECMSYEADSIRTFEIEVDGVPVTLVVPDWLPPVEIVVAAKKEDLLFLLGHIRAPKEWKIGNPGAVLVARRREDGSYAVHLWHETYEWALRYLRSEAPKSGSEAR